MKQVIAMHGWSGDHRIWAPWERHFIAMGWQWQSGERGYGHFPTQQPEWRCDADPIQVQRRVLIGHSLGPHLLREVVLAQATDVVLLASFSRFVPPGRAGRALQTGLMGMQRCIGTESEVMMLHTFLRRSTAPANSRGLPPSPISEGLSSAGRERLQKDLALLIATKGLPDGLPNQAKVLVVQAGSDGIVAPEAQAQLLEDLHTHQQRAATVWTLKNTGHALLQPDLLLRVGDWLDDPTSTAAMQKPKP